MRIKKFWLTIGLLIITVAAASFTAGAISAGSVFPALDRAVDDYSRLIGDIREAVVEVEKRKGAVNSEEKRKELDKMARELRERVAALQEEQKKDDQAWKDFVDFFSGSQDGNDTSPPPARRRP